ncbi:hypothetical protein F0562_012225 [Nyssa sinensis]|uniref:Uncharacterized protein n=1 Tax=Nyssa sinensis TaxID=561372 RepID=A0A5J4ZVU8_9ASTE|nr:hypothetical protein F0562_012225 [Nyssa sinensis]
MKFANLHQKGLAIGCSFYHTLLGIAPVADASSPQSRVDLLTLGLAVINILVSQFPNSDGGVQLAYPLSQSLRVSRASSFTKGSEGPTTIGSFQLSHLHSIKKAHLPKDHVQCATGRRRGIIEDLHLAIEIFEEAIFDVVHKAAHCLFSPFETSRTLLRWFYSHSRGTKDIPASSSDASVSNTTLGNNKSNAYRKEDQFPSVP